jgi:hypothetical protein
MSKLTIEEEYKILDDYFSMVENDDLADMAFQYFEELKTMCLLLSLDFQLEKEGYNEENNRILS